MNNTTWTFLSHPIKNEQIGYAGRVEFRSQNTKSIAQGNSCNQMEWTLNNHVGTHVDCPRHFDANGATVTDYTAASWVFTKPQLITCEVQSAELIFPEQITRLIHEDTDFLILKTSFEKFRGSETYWKKNPGLTPELGYWLRENHPRLKAIGFDFISATSYEHGEIGKKAHQAFLAPWKNLNPILIFEDMNLTGLFESPLKIIALPILVQDADGAPVTLIAEVKL